MSEQFHITSDGKFVDSYVLRPVSGGPASNIIQLGNWFMTGINTIFFDYPNHHPDFPTTGVIAGDELTVSFGGRGASSAWLFTRK